MVNNKKPRGKTKQHSEEFYFPLQINWELLKRFNVVANSYSFIDAARKIGTSASALLTQLDALEKEVGYNLFKRTNKNRSKILTREGELLKEATQHIFLFLSIPLSEQAKQVREKPKVLKIITTDGLAKTILYEPIRAFMDAHPGLQLELITRTNPELIEPGEVVIRGDFMEQKNTRRDYLTSYHFQLCASKDYLEKYGTPKNPLDLVNHKILLNSFKSSGDRSLQWREDLNIHLTPYITSDSVDFLAQACEEGAGILEVADIYLKDTKLVQILPDISSERGDIYVAYNKKSTHEQLIPDFVAFLKDRISGTKKIPKPKTVNKKMGRPRKDRNSS